MSVSAVYFAPIYTGTAKLRGQQATITIFQRLTISPLNSSRSVIFGRSITWKYESLIGGTIEKGLMAGHGTLQVIDPHKEVFLHLSTCRTNGGEDLDFPVEITGTGIHIQGYIRLENIRTVEAHWIRVPVLSLQIYDGVGVLNELVKSNTGQTMLGQIQASLWSFTGLLITMNFMYRLDIGVSNAPTGQFLAHLRSITADEDWDVQRKFQDMLQLAWEMMGVRIWQGMDERWHLEQPHLMGQAASYYLDPVGGSVTTGTATANVLQLSRGDFDEGLTRTLRKPVVAVEMEREYKTRQITVAGAEQPLECTLLRAGGFNQVHNNWVYQWLGSGSTGTGAQDLRGRSDTCLFLEPTEGNQQELPWMDAGEEITMLFRGWFALENAGTGGSQSAYLRFTWVPWNDVLDATYFVDANGKFTTTPTIIATPSVSVQAFGTNPFTWEEFWLTIVERAPCTGRLVVELMGCTDGGGPGGYNTLWDDVSMQFCNAEADDGTGKPALVESRKVAATLRSFNAVTGEYLQGETVKLKSKVPHVSYVFRATSPADSYAFEFLEYSWFDSGATPNRYQQQYWQYGGNDYTDPLEALFWYLQDLMGTWLWELSGTVNRIAPPERPLMDENGVSYFMVRGSIDLVEGQTEGVWIENKLAPA